MRAVRLCLLRRLWACSLVFAGLPGPSEAAATAEGVSGFASMPALGCPTTSGGDAAATIEVDTAEKLRVALERLDVPDRALSS
jgi:pectate lyase